MKLKIRKCIKQHKDVCTALGWANSNELLSFSDDKVIWKWNSNGELNSKLCEVDAYITDVHWVPRNSKKQSSTDVFVASCADGSFRLIAPSGRVEKLVKDAHKGAVVTIRWNYEGTAIATGGEDGFLKIWARGGALRSTLASTGKCVYSLAWGTQSEHILFTCGNDLIIKPIHAASKQIQWKAHDGPVLKVDWNPLTNFIVSAGEDGKYKVWDAYGRNIYSSNPFEYAITSVSWSPSGEFFAVGSYNLLKVCDKTGWSISSESTDTGSILNISWTSDSTQLAAAGGNGSVCFGQLLERTLQWKNLIVTLIDSLKIRIYDIIKESSEEFDFRDKVINMSFGFSHLIIATTTQCWIFNVESWSSPHIFDVKDNVNLIMQCQKAFLMMDNFSGIQVFSYEGRLKCNPKFPGLRTDLLSQQCISLSNDILAIVDNNKKKSINTVKLFDINTGNPFGETVIQHPMEYVEIALDQCSNTMERKLAFIDRNRDLYICNLRTNEKHKLATMVDSMKWNDQSDMLAAISDGKFIVWYYPTIVFVDIDLLPMTQSIKEESNFGQKSQIIDFFGTRCNIRRWNGVVVTIPVSPYPLMLFELVEKKRWKGTMRLCRFVKDQSLWTCLAGMAIKEGQLDTAEVALAAIEEVDKLEYISEIKKIPSVEGRNAELLLYQRRQAEAESILLQAGLIYRAIKMHLNLYNFSRALQISKKWNNFHLDTVVAYRQRYIERFHLEEQNPEFLELQGKVVIDWNKIKQKEQEELEKERQRPGSKPYSNTIY